MTSALHKKQTSISETCKFSLETNFLRNKFLEMRTNNTLIKTIGHYENMLDILKNQISKP